MEAYLRREKLRDREAEEQAGDVDGAEADARADVGVEHGVEAVGGALEDEEAEQRSGEAGVAQECQVGVP